MCLSPTKFAVQCPECEDQPKHTHIVKKMSVLNIVQEEHEYGAAALILLETRRGVKYQTRVFENKPLYGKAKALKPADQVKVKGWTFGGGVNEDETRFFNMYSI